jgi:hypothetical protein
LFFATLAKLAELDPYEGKFPRRIISELAARYTPQHDRNAYPDGTAAAHADEERNRRCRAVSGWHINETESAAMWKLYSGDHGLAIRTTLGALKKSFVKDERPIYIYEVEYLDFAGKALPTLPFYSGFAKRKSFAHERELRACVFVPEDDTSPGTCVTVDLDMLIETVFVAPEAEPWLKEVVEGVMKVYKICKPVVQSVLYDEAVW